MEDGGPRADSARCIAIAGPYGSGKTTLLEAILAHTGAINRKGTIEGGNTIGDASEEARAHSMSVEVNSAYCTYLGDPYFFVDCPGSVEFIEETRNALQAADAVIVVTEPDTGKIGMLQPLLKTLVDENIPHFIFVNKIDKSDGSGGTGRIRGLLEALQPVSPKPLILRQVPIWENGIATGFVDLALERAFVYREHAMSEVIELPDDFSEREATARYEMLEKLSDYDDHLMEELLEDIEPPADEVFETLRRELSEGLVTPVFMGSALKDNGLRRLLKALRHEAPTITQTAARLGLNGADGSVVNILKTYHTPHSGKLSLVRVLSGEIKDGDTLFDKDGKGERIAGMFDLLGLTPRKREKAGAGDTIALGRLESASTGDLLSSGKIASLESVFTTPRIPPVYALAISPRERKDEVKLSGAMAKLLDEDPSLDLEHNQDTGELIIHGQGEVHLRVAMERLANKYGIVVDSRQPTIAYKEAIRKNTSERGRHKRQSGGHGQFGDVVLEVGPLARGEGFQFNEKITGGVVPKQYFSAVENGARESLVKGPLAGFPVVDVSVTLVDGSYHAVDSSEQAFKTAGRIGVQAALKNCSPVLLEPIMVVTIHVPSAATARVNSIVSTRRGQLLGYDARPGWAGWDSVKAYVPQSELHNLIVELRSATQGIGTYESQFDRLQELTGKLAEQVIADHKKDGA